MMGPQPEPPIDDPLLRPDSGPRDHLGAPVRAPLGNSIRTLIVFVLLVLVGAGIWWWRRPADLATDLGGREWVITAVDGAQAVNALGTASTFVLDGTGEIRGALDCNVATGEWTYDTQRSRLAVAWNTQTDLICADDWPTTFLPTDGDVTMRGAMMRISGDAADVEAISMVDADPADLRDVAGSWTSGDSDVEIGARGSVRVGTCRGDWSLVDDGPRMTIRFDTVQRDDCELPTHWATEMPLDPVLHDGSLYLRRARTIFPLDRDIIRLDPTDS